MTSTKLTIHKNYLVWTVILLVVEICIALFVHDRFVRPYLGDTLVVMLIYCFIKSFLNLPVLKTAMGVLVFSFLIEALQYIHFINLVGLQNSRLANVVLGNSFGWLDLVAYAAGIALILLIENIGSRIRLKSTTKST